MNKSISFFLLSLSVLAFGRAYSARRRAGYCPNAAGGRLQRNGKRKPGQSIRRVRQVLCRQGLRPGYRRQGRRPDHDGKDADYRQGSPHVFQQGCPGHERLAGNGGEIRSTATAAWPTSGPRRCGRTSFIPTPSALKKVTGTSSEFTVKTRFWAEVYRMNAVRRSSSIESDWDCASTGEYETKLIEEIKDELPEVIRAGSRRTRYG